MRLSLRAIALPQHAGSSAVLNWFEFSYILLQFVTWNSLSLRQFMVRELWSQRQPWEGFIKRLLALFPHLPQTDSAATRSELGWAAVLGRETTPQGGAIVLSSLAWLRHQVVRKPILSSFFFHHELSRFYQTFNPSHTSSRKPSQNCPRLSLV